MVITACAHPQTDDARGLVFEPYEPTIARYLSRKEGPVTSWLIFAAGILFGWGLVVILAVITDPRKGG